jgi:hypothetical protein
MRHVALYTRVLTDRQTTENQREGTARHRGPSRLERRPGLPRRGDHPFRSIPIRVPRCASWLVIGIEPRPIAILERFIA